MSARGCGGSELSEVAVVFENVDLTKQCEVEGVQAS